MAAWIRGFALSATLLAASKAEAEPCQVPVELAGDPALVATVRELLAPRDAAVAGDHCPAVRVRVERRGGAIAVVRVTEVVEERIVSAPETAAAVIESWSRTDLEEPLLAIAPPPGPLMPPTPPTPPTPQPVAAPVEPLAAPGVSSSVRPLPAAGARRLQVFAAIENSFADDQTTWTGAAVGVCVPLGGICASARARFAAVTGGPPMWQHAERQAEDLLFGGDVPIGLGRTRLALGFGAGMGSVHTRARDGGVRAGSETFGLRADVHAAWMVPISSSFAIDLSASVDLAQVVHVEKSEPTSIAAEPWLVGRLGAGLRFGGR